MQNPRAPAPKTRWRAFLLCARAQACTVHAKAKASTVPGVGGLGRALSILFFSALSRSQVRQQSRDGAKGAAANSLVAAAAADDCQQQPGNTATTCEPEPEAAPEVEAAKGQGHGQG